MKPSDDLPPTTVITHVLRHDDGSLLVRGTTADEGAVKRVIVNGREAQAVTPNFAEWQIRYDKSSATRTVSAHAEDEAGNIEPRPHVVAVQVSP